MNKPALIVFGNCQAEWVAHAVGAIPEVTDRLDVNYLYSFNHPETGPATPNPDVLGRCALLLEQRGAWDRFRWCDALPAAAEIVTFPALTMDALWPLTTFSDPRNVPELPEYPFGRFPYGDRLISDWLVSGLSREETLARYLTWPVRDTEDLGRAQEIGEMRMEMTDAACDVKMADEILMTMRDEPLFYTCNHPRPALLSTLVGRVLATTSLTVDADAARQILRGFFDEKRPNDNIQVPIHPDVAAALKLSWYRDDARYCCYGLTNLSYADYWREYCHY